MYQRFLTAVLTVALLGWAGAVQADPVIYDNGVSGSATWASQRGTSFSTPMGPFNAQTADDFTLAGGGPDWRITDVHWEGTAGYGGGRFRVIFYAPAVGEPTGGGGLADPTPTALAVRDVAVTTMDDPTDASDDIYWADIDPVILSGGTYWLSVQALEDIPGPGPLLQYFWSADTSGGNAVQGFDLVSLNYWTEKDSEMVFSLTGTQIPAPGAALLAMLGLPAIGWVKRRFA